MKRSAVMMISGILFFSMQSMAVEQSLSVGTVQPESGVAQRAVGGAALNSGTGSEVIVTLPPQAWTQGQNNQPPCMSCCSYENRSYTEGAVVKMAGVLLQCRRDPHALGTNNLIWQTVK